MTGIVRFLREKVLQKTGRLTVSGTIMAKWTTWRQMRTKEGAVITLALRRSCIMAVLGVRSRKKTEGQG